MAQIFRQRLVPALVFSFVLPGLAAGLPNASFELRLPPGHKAEIAARPARDLALAAFEAEEAAPAAFEEVAGGSVRLALPAAGSWRIAVTAAGFLGAEVLLPGLAEPARLPPLDLRPAAPASLMIRADGRPAAGLLVLARPLEAIFAAPWSPATSRATSDAGGRAEIPGGLACDVVVAGAAGPLWRGRLSLAAGALHEIYLAPPRAYELRLLGSDGLPAAGVRLAVDGLLLREASSAAGKISFAAVAPPSLRVLAPGGSWASRPADPAPAAAPAALELQLAPPQQLALRVFDRESLRPVAGALVWPGAHPEILARSGDGGEAKLSVPWGGAGLVHAAAAAYRPLVAERTQAARLLLQPAPRGIAARGRVEDLEERPIAGAKVTLRPSAEQLRQEPEKEDDRPAQKTGADGTFAFEEVAAAEVDLEVRAPGFAPALVRGVAVEPPPAGAAEPRVAELGTVVLEPGVAIAGRVATAAGEPLEGARVAAREPRQPNLQETLSGPDGAFRFSDFAAGTEIELRAEHPDARSATLLTRAGEEEEVLLMLEAASRVAGRVSLEGKGAEGVLVLLRSAGATQASARTGEDGRFELKGVEPGLLELQTVARGLFGEALHFELASGESVEDLEVELSSGAIVEGKVTDQAGRPLGRVVVELASGQDDLRSRLAASRAYSGDDGSYRIEGLPPGAHTLRARRIDLLTAEQRLEIEGGTRQLDWSLAAGLELAGQIVDAERRPVAGARISAFDGDNRAVGDGVRSDASGHFLLQGVAAGPLRVVGESDSQPVAETATVVPAAGAEPPAVLLVCPAAASVEGRLLGASFEALARAQVWAMAKNGRHRPGQVAYDGSYRIGGLAAGEWRVHASAPGFPREAAGRLELRDGERGSLDLELSRDGYRLAGVVRRGGEPLNGIVVVAAALATGTGGGSRTAAGGSFAIESLPAGSYQVTLLGEGVNQTRQVELQGDFDLTFDLDLAAPPDPAAAVSTPTAEEHR